MRTLIFIILFTTASSVWANFWVDKNAMMNDLSYVAHLGIESQEDYETIKQNGVLSYYSSAFLFGWSPLNTLFADEYAKRIGGDIHTVFPRVFKSSHYSSGLMRFFNPDMSKVPIVYLIEGQVVNFKQLCTKIGLEDFMSLNSKWLAYDQEVHKATMLFAAAAGSALGGFCVAAVAALFGGILTGVGAASGSSYDSGGGDDVIKMFIGVGIGVGVLLGILGFSSLAHAQSIMPTDPRPGVDVLNREIMAYNKRLLASNG